VAGVFGDEDVWYGVGEVVVLVDVVVFVEFDV